MDMHRELEQLRELVGVDTDIALAAKLGVDRSTISQWRRRGQVPQRYREMLIKSIGRELNGYDPSQRSAARRAIYGDGDGRYILAAALAVTRLDALDFGTELGPGNCGWARESRILSVVQVVLQVCKSLFGKNRCETDEEYLRLLAGLETDASKALIEYALTVAAVGEL